MSTPEHLTKILDSFGMDEPEGVRRLGGTATPKYEVRVPQGRFVLRMRPAEFSDDCMIRFDHESLRRLDEHGLPVPCPRIRPDGTSWARTEDGVFELLSWVEGDPFSPGDLTAIASLGTFLARFHSVLSGSIPLGKEGMLREDHPDLLAAYVRQLEELCHVQHDRRQVERMAEQLHRVRVNLDDGLYSELPKAVIHGDIHPGNVRFKGSQVSAVYDFDYLSLQARVRDIVDGLMFFAADRDKPLDPDDICSLTQTFQPDLTRASILLDGYQRVERLSDIEWRALPWLIRSQWLQIRLRGSRKVTPAKKLTFVLDGFFEMTDWLDREAPAFFEHLQRKCG